MWRCINRITMEPFYSALFLMEISYPDTPQDAAWPQTWQIKARQGSAPRGECLSLEM